MRKFRVGVLTFSDERPYLHERHLETNRNYQKRLVRTLEQTGEVEVFQGKQIIGSPRDAREESSRLKQVELDVVIFNYAIWCYPRLSAIAATQLACPVLLFSNLHPSEPGMVGMLAAAGTMEQLGVDYYRVWGDIEDGSVKRRVMEYVRGTASVSMLSGQTFGTFGGRPLGMYTAVANLDQWQKQFGIDIDFHEQWDIVRYAEDVPVSKVEHAQGWLEKRVGTIAYDGAALTPKKLQLAIRSYYALRRIIEERNLDFIGIKAHGDLTDHFVTMDVAEAFLNDPYDWDGPHEPIVAATESDMDGALTMQILKQITRGSPVLFSDVRHFDYDRGVWYFSNSGTHPTYFAGRSLVPEENLDKVSFLPEVPDFPAGGPSVHHYAASGAMTFARLARKSGEYVLYLVPGELVSFPKEEADAMGATITPPWPVAFASIKASPETFLSRFPCNHIHGVYGDFYTELRHAAAILGVRVEEIT
jgi:L-fucose isomerase